MNSRVLIVTGGLITAKDRSLYHTLKKQVIQWKRSEDAWLDLKIKAVAAESLVCGFRELKKSRDPLVKSFFEKGDNFQVPELTEVVIATLLNRENIPYSFATVTDVLEGSRKFKESLKAFDCIFLSSTLLRDLSEIEPVVERLLALDRKIVLGGSLAGPLAKKKTPLKGIDLLAVGYGETLIPKIAEWIRSGYQSIDSPPEGRHYKCGEMHVLHSGSPQGKNLDHLIRPDWKLSEKDHEEKFPMIHYESVRGCPYRCSFCNYPYLFDDSRFRFKSAQKIARDWEHYSKELGIEYITCLDSLFTMPKKRLVELCEILIRKRIKVKWICYARAGDLTDESTIELMKEAGAHQVQIGIESGDQKILDNMNKRCSVEDNAIALDLCRKMGLTSVVSVIVGYPGETKETLENTYQFLKHHPPDFFFLATFSTRSQDVPVLSKESRERFGLSTSQSSRTVAPYWTHRTMSCLEAGNQVRELEHRLMRGEISLNAALFYQGVLRFKPSQRNALLKFQAKAIDSYPLTRLAFDQVNRKIDQRLSSALTAMEDRAQSPNQSDLKDTNLPLYPSL